MPASDRISRVSGADIYRRSTGQCTALGSTTACQLLGVVEYCGGRWSNRNSRCRSHVCHLSWVCHGMCGGAGRSTHTQGGGRRNTPAWNRAVGTHRCHAYQTLPLTGRPRPRRRRRRRRRQSQRASSTSTSNKPQGDETRHTCPPMQALIKRGGLWVQHDDHAIDRGHSVEGIGSVPLLRHELRPKWPHLEHVSYTLRFLANGGLIGTKMLADAGLMDIGLCVAVK